MFVDTFIRRPILASVCSLVLVLAGLIAIPTLPIAQFPQIAAPQVVVSSFYTGASAQVVETAVTTPLEQAINGVEGMAYMTSTSGNDGTSQITVTFDVTRDIDIAAVDVQNRVSQAEGRLPNEVKQVGISVTKQGSGFLMGAAMVAERGEYDSLFMSNYIDVYIRDAIKRIPGVAEVIIFGERKYAMRLWLDPDRLAARGLTAADVVRALGEQNVQVAAGQVGQAPARPGQSYQISVRAVGRLTEPDEFADIILASGQDGALVRVADVGRVELGAENYASMLRYNGQEAVGFGVLQLPTANALDVYQRITEELARLEQRFPPGLKVQLAFDTTTVVAESIREVLITLAEAIVLVVLVMFLFLQDWRSTIIPTITIPVSLIGTFAFVKLFGFSINTLTLFGITLATGLVVDDAIVVIENIQRHMHDYGKSARAAASEAMGEVAGAVIATGLVLATVFVPVALFPGTQGRLYQQFALTIAVSMGLSVFNALTLTPALSALLLRGERPHGVFFRFVNRVIEAGTAFYVRVLRLFVRWKWTVTAAFVLTLGLTYAVFRIVPTGFVPDEDQGYLIIALQAPDGASLEHSAGIARQVEAIVRAQPEVQGVFTVVGFSFAGASPNRGLFFINLQPFEERQRADQSAQALVGRLWGALGGVTDAIAVPFLPPAIDGVGNFGGFTFQVLDEGGGDIGALAGATQALVAQGNQTPGLTGLFTGFTASDPQLVVSIDRERAKAQGIELGAITDTLQTLVGSRYVNDFEFGTRSYRVYVQADEQFRAAPSDIERYYVRNARGEMTRLADLVEVSSTTAPQVISHYNLFRSAEINGSPAPGTSSGQAIAIMEDVARRTLPQGMTFAWSGISREEIEAAGQAGLIFGLGLLLVYLTLAAQYESVTLPFIIMLSVPLALLGALGAQLARGLINDVYCQIGLVMLIGLSAKNGILIVEFAEQLRRRGLAPAEAAVEAARVRLRPILMTSLAFILGVLPLAFASGAGQAARHSVGTAVAGGMAVSTFLNVVFIPVLYLVVRTIVPAREAAPLAEPERV
ncbi:MAG: multidrug efflux RND transporter permease subunit [Vicinamibacteraceae bacterium]|nr:multidrug efflux RND transporter permease subunit [Vicinamibacteraceae bacterium]